MRRIRVTQLENNILEITLQMDKDRFIVRSDDIQDALDAFEDLCMEYNISMLYIIKVFMDLQAVQPGDFVVYSVE